MRIVMLSLTCTAITSSQVKIVRVVKADLHAHGVWIVRNPTLARTLARPLQ
jgi:hypothetical protein